MSQQQFQTEVMDELKQQEQKMSDYNTLRKINVNEHTELKGKLTYLSWTYAVDTLLQHDPMATWEFPEPKYFGDSVMVYCNVTAFGKTMKMQLPVMDNYNKAMSNPNTRSISDATMRCLAKCIACFGIGLYIYAGSDLPDIDVEDLIKAMNGAKNKEELTAIYKDAIKQVGTNKEAHAQVVNAAKQISEKFKE